MTTLIENKNLWSVKETAARLGVSERTLHTHTAPRGTLKCVKIGARIGYRPETVEKWLQEREGRDEPTEAKSETCHDKHTAFTKPQEAETEREAESPF